MTGNLQADGVQSRQTLFGRYCLLILIIQENRGEINREYYGGTASVCLTARICLMETLHKARLTALYAICLQCFLREKEKKWIWGRSLGREICLFCKVVQKSGKKS